MGKKIQSHGPKKQAGIVIPISNKTDFKLKAVKRDKEGYFILVTGKKSSRGNLKTEYLDSKHKGTLILKKNTAKA